MPKIRLKTIEKSLLKFEKSTIWNGLIKYIDLPLLTLDISIEKCYNHNMIKTFANKETAKLYDGFFTKKIPSDIQQIARRKLRMLNNSHSLLDLQVPPSNKLEKLTGERKNQYSIRINDQWRICFEWKNNDAHNVKIIDYH